VFFISSTDIYAIILVRTAIPSYCLEVEVYSRNNGRLWYEAQSSPRVTVGSAWGLCQWYILLQISPYHSASSRLRKNAPRYWSSHRLYGSLFDMFCVIVHDWRMRCPCRCEVPKAHPACPSPSSSCLCRWWSICRIENLTAPEGQLNGPDRVQRRRGDVAAIPPGSHIEEVSAGPVILPLQVSPRSVTLDLHRTRYRLLLRRGRCQWKAKADRPEKTRKRYGMGNLRYGGSLGVAERLRDGWNKINRSVNSKGKPDFRVNIQHGPVLMQISNWIRLEWLWNEII